MKKYKIGIACDHAGYEKKEIIKKYLQSLENYDVIDFGTSSADSVDYPDFAHFLGKAINSKNCDLGISLCGSGNGISMTLNKYANVRAALCWNNEISELARLHNDANICSLPARFISDDDALKIINTFLNTPFEGGRHQNRIDKMPIK